MRNRSYVGGIVAPSKLFYFLLPFALLLGTGRPAPASSRYDRYAVILADAPVAAYATSAKDLPSAVSRHLGRLEAAHTSLRQRLATQQIEVTGDIRTLANIIFVRATPEQAARLATLPGISRVERLLPIRRLGEPAADLMKVSTAWKTVGGATNAGAGMRIAVVDTGIDIHHPALQDDSLTRPDDTPACDQASGACDYVNSKVIVARSYVKHLVGDIALYTRPDDMTPRDRSGHGTAVAALAAGVPTISGPYADTGGVAPKAFLGNYKIFGSPGVNDITFYDAVASALEDALADKMDVAVLAFGSPALWGANDQGSNCGIAAGEYCDWRIQVVENAIKLGLTIVAAAGDDGGAGYYTPAYGTIETPGTSPSVITVGSMTNSHEFYSTITFGGKDYYAMMARGYQFDGTFQGPLKDVSKLTNAGSETTNDGTACVPLADGSLSGAVALVQFGLCDYTIQINNAQKAGATAVVLYQYSGYDDLFRPAGILDTGIPAAMIGSSDATTIKTALATATDTTVTIDPSVIEDYSEDYAYWVAPFSSYGPALGTNSLKPDVIVPATGLYVATQSYDPNSNLYDKDGYTVVQGSSFGAGLVAGVAALVKQQNPGLTPAQIKGAIVGTGDDLIYDIDSSGNTFYADVISIGSGLVDASAALTTNVVADPVSVSFAPAASALPQTITISNLSDSTVTLTATLQSDLYDGFSAIRVSPTTLVIPPKSTGTMVAGLSITATTGADEGRILLQGGAVTIQIPYIYLQGDGVPANIVPIYGDNFAFDTSGEIRRPALAVRVIDGYGMPVVGLPAEFVAKNGGLITTQSGTTDYLGIADAGIVLGPDAGPQKFAVELSGVEMIFTGRARPRPAITAGGVTNAASREANTGYAPGSFIAIAGTGLSEASKTRTTPYLPLSLAGVSLSFDVPDPKISVPGRLVSVSDGLIIAQIPWELQGQAAAQIKVSIGDSSSDLYTLPIADVSPAGFEVDDPAGRIFDAKHAADASAVTSAKPAAAGETVLLYCNGLGAVENGPASGEPAVADPEPKVKGTVKVTIGGASAEVTKQTIAAGSAGRYQLSVVVPGGIGTGLQPVVVTVNDVAAKPVNLPIQ